MNDNSNANYAEGADANAADDDDDAYDLLLCCADNIDNIADMTLTLPISIISTLLLRKG